MTSLSRVTFLIVDDNSYMVSIIETILRGFGAARIFCAKDATEAFHRLKSDQIDIVVVDYMMPVLDGIDFTKLVRQSSDSANPYIPIVMLTAHSEKSRVEAARDAGVTEFCCKPVTANELFRKIVSIVDHPRDFVRTASFYGPDRRRKDNDSYDGPERRAAAPASIPAPAAELV